MTSSKPDSDAIKLARMAKQSKTKDPKVRERLAKLMDAYRKKNSY